MLSLTSEYALRAVIHLAQHADEWPIPAKRIAQQAGIPPKYLSKILGDLVRGGVLEATRGIGGGFRMTHSPRKTSLMDVLTPFEPFDHRRCPFGNKLCGDENPCLAHEGWKKVVVKQQDFLRKTSVHSVAIPKTARPRPTAKKQKR